jgi:hypothetical protein
VRPHTGGSTDGADDKVIFTIRKVGE